MLQCLVNIGNRNARSDATTGAQLAYAAIKGSKYAVLSNISGIQDENFSRLCREECFQIALKARELIQSIDAQMTSPEEGSC
jgi:formiminotetrahydrofolate cyclodeaminase